MYSIRRRRVTGTEQCSAFQIYSKEANACVKHVLRCHTPQLPGVFPRPAPLLEALESQVGDKGPDTDGKIRPARSLASVHFCQRRKR